MLNRLARIVSRHLRNISMLLLAALATPVFAAWPSPVDLFTAGDFAVLANTGITTVTGSPTVITGDIGNTNVATQITGFSLAVDATNDFATSVRVIGKVFASDYTGGQAGSNNLTPAKMVTAGNDLTTAYNNTAAETALPANTELYAGNIGGRNFAAGVYKWSSGVIFQDASAVAGNVTLTGSASDVFIFIIAQNLIVPAGVDVTSGVKVILAGGAQARNVFWAVGGGAGASLGTYCTFNGNILSKTDIAVGTGAVLNGRALSWTQVTLNGNPITAPPTAVPAPVLQGSLTPSTTTFQPFQLTLTVTNTGDANATNVKAVAWDSNGAVLAGPTPASVAILAPLAAQTFTWTATPSGVGVNIIYSATAMEDSVAMAVSAEATATVFVPTRLGAYLTPAKTQITVGQAVQLTLTVTNAGTTDDTNIKAQARSAPYTNTGPVPPTRLLLAAGSSTTFAWTATPAGAGTFVFSATASGDSLSPSLLASATILVQTPPVISGILTTGSATTSGGSFIMVLTITNTGQASASVNVTTAGFRSSGSGTATIFVGPTPVIMPVSVANGTPVTLTYTVTAGIVGTGFTISNTLYLTDENGGPALSPVVVTSSTVAIATLGGLQNSLSVYRTGAALGQPATFVLTVTNTGGTLITNLTASLTTDGPATIGIPTASATTLAPGARATFTWAVTPTGTDSRVMTFTARASGVLVGGQPVAATAVTAELAGIPLPGVNATYVFPSPAKDVARIAYTMEQAGTVNIRVYNAAGQLVATLDESKAAGLQSSAITTSKLAPGVYYYLLERRYGSGSPVKIGVRKFVVTR